MPERQAEQGRFLLGFSSQAERPCGSEDLDLPESGFVGILFRNLAMVACAPIGGRGDIEGLSGTEA
jgi:hypothetical protein